MPLAQPAVRLVASLACSVLVWSGTALHAQDAASVRRGDADEVVRTGVQLERSRRWLEAIEHYEEALDEWPDNDKIRYGLRRSKIHFGVDRRYSDGSFETKLLRKSRAESMRHFEDVVGHVRTHYVDQLTTTSFVAHGTESLYLALGSDKFRDAHLRNVDPERVKAFRRTLRDDYWNRPINDGREAERVVNEVANLAQQSLGLSPTATIMEYVFGGCNALDDYSSYLTPDRLDDLYGNIEGEFVGLGIEMKAENEKGLVLVDVLPGSPAEEGGLRPGESIVEVDGTDVRNATTDEGAKLLRGPSGSNVRLRIHDSERDRVRSGNFVRRAVTVKSIPTAEIVDRANGIGYIRMTGFQKSTVDEMDAALRKLNGQGMRALVWDLRGNPGGLLTTAVEVLDRFIDEGVLVSTKGRGSDQNWSYSARRPGTWNVPLVLLVDGNSASASEIVAGAVRDHQRGTIVGRKTYGKWSVQSIFPLAGQTGLRLTTAKFYSPKGLTHGKVGVKPHVSVELADGNRYRNRKPNADSDPDLRAGRDILRKSLASR